MRVSRRELMVRLLPLAVRLRVTGREVSPAAKLSTDGLAVMATEGPMALTTVVASALALLPARSQAVTLKP